jgi:hypothetical protein
MSSLVVRINRYFLRRTVHKAVAQQQQVGPESQLLGRTWASLMANPLFRFRLRYLLPTDDANFNAEALRFLIEAYPKLFSSIHISAPQHFIRELKKNAPFVAVQLHDGAPNLTKLLVNHQRPLSRVVKDTDKYLTKLQAAGLDTSYVHLIENNIKSLSRLREAARRKHVICCAIDYEKDVTGRRAYLSPTIFKFAQNLRLPVIFTKHDVDSQGCAQIWTSPPVMVTDPIQSAIDFQTFYNSIPGKKVHLSIKGFIPRLSR